MLRNILISLLTAFIFSGCYSWVQFQDGYKQAKIMYQDTKYVIYEVMEEKKQVEKEFTAQQ